MQFFLHHCTKVTPKHF